MKLKSLVKYEVLRYGLWQDFNLFKYIDTEVIASIQNKIMFKNPTSSIKRCVKGDD